MEKIRISSIVILFAVFTFVFTSCEKEDIANTADAVATTEDDAAAEGMFDDAFDQAEMYENGITKNATFDYCQPTITIDFPEMMPYPRVVTIDFGTEGCEGKHGAIRKGKIIVTVTAFFLESGSKRIVTFDGYSVNDFQIEGTKTVTNMGKNESGNWVRKIEIDGKVTKPDGTEITRVATRSREWVEGADTPLFFWDDVFSITGNATGVNRKGVAYTADITTALIKARNCRWIQEGVITIVSGENTVVIDYGDGTCDNVATATINGEEKEIKFKW
ncbi:MAG: hypothetical protein B6I20_04060 [Bacteroidetes bacterium 4572_117]|nr:MAG: hypothetical protein B6I20_04060 [Bacteroidetes bacterium 4572_117]